MSRVWLVYAVLLSFGLSAEVQAQAVDTLYRNYNARLEALLDQYFKIQKTLASDSLAGVRQATAAVAALAEADPDTSTVGQVLLLQIRRVAENMHGTDLPTTRREFSELSKCLIAALRLSYSGGQKYYPYTCKMENKSWIQREEEVQNPYLGSSMLTCGEAISLSRGK